MMILWTLLIDSILVHRALEIESSRFFALVCSVVVQKCCQTIVRSFREGVCPMLQYVTLTSPTIDSPLFAC